MITALILGRVPDQPNTPIERLLAIARAAGKAAQQLGSMASSQISAEGARTMEEMAGLAQVPGGSAYEFCGAAYRLISKVNYSSQSRIPVGAFRAMTDVAAAALLDVCGTANAACAEDVIDRTRRAYLQNPPDLPPETGMLIASNRVAGLALASVGSKSSDKGTMMQILASAYSGLKLNEPTISGLVVRPLFDNKGTRPTYRWAGDSISVAPPTPVEPEFKTGVIWHGLGEPPPMPDLEQRPAGRPARTPAF